LLNNFTDNKFFKKEKCRLCLSSDLELVSEFKSTPLANDFVPSSLLDINQPLYPLGILFCESCSHVQLSHVVNPKLMFEHYVYVSSTSQSFVNHFKNYEISILEKYSPAPNSLIVDIGSNDGVLLNFFKEDGFKVLGVDPATNLAVEANNNGIETINSFFTYELSDKLTRDYGKASVVVANNVFAHIDDLHDVTKGISKLLADDGIFVFEVSYLKQVIANNLFDTIYHEHLSYHTLIPLLTFFDNNDMTIIDCEEVDTHGGSIRVVVQKKNGPKPVSDSVRNLINIELKLGLNTIDPILSLSNKIKELNEKLNSLVHDIKNEGLQLIGYGAPAKATTLLYEFELSDQIDYIIDDNPLKQGLYTPGSHIPVVNADVLRQEIVPEYMIILAWNFAEQIMENNDNYLKKGGHFILPLPDLQVY
tara:strand:- start:2001 stop:3260 length:1260 start_codon:yes stop_codon:yes gene_type:complete